jgi:anthranilate synthase component 1
MFIRQFPDKAQFEKLAKKHNVIPVCVEILADTETPVSVLKKMYQNKGPAFLLESVEGGERWGRFSFLSVSAKSHVQVFSREVRILENGSLTKIPHNGDPLAVLRDFMGRFNPADMPELPRFWGGLVGYLTYEMVSFFEKIPNLLPEDAPIADFIIPDEVLIFDNIRNTLLCIAICFIDKTHCSDKDINEAFDLAKNRCQSIQDIINHPIITVESSLHQKDYRLLPVLENETFRKRVRKVKEHILAGDVIQTVISQPFVCADPPDPLSLYRIQRYVNPSPYLFFMHLNHTVLVGSSPETMVRMENGIANLRPIAGTRPRGENEMEDERLAQELLADEKERAEHLMLVDLGRNDLGRVSQTGSVCVTDLMIVEKYSHVMHIVSNITSRLKSDCDAWELIRATFPAGTLSGAPKVRAMEIIADIENEYRGPYGGAVGYISFSGNMDMAITIRTACLEKGALTVRAGAGIVYDSDPEKERIETINKAMSIQKALQLLQRGEEP